MVTAITAALVMYVLPHLLALGLAAVLVAREP